jgi:cysteinyl-tRNA synthetase, unknown class
MKPASTSWQDLAARWATWPRIGLLLLSALFVVIGSYVVEYRDILRHRAESQSGKRPLMAAKSWYYHLSQIDVDKIAMVDADVLVIDFAKDGGKAPMTVEEVQRIRMGPNGKPRIVISYFSIGEAEEFRFYWKPEWKTNPPSWDGGENCAWPGAHLVRYWQDDWKNIIFRGDNSYLKQVVAAGFDGIYLDRIDVFEHHKDAGGRDLVGDMINFVAELKSAGTALKPGFLVIAQNAEELLLTRRYRDVIDGLGKEDLLFGAKGTGQRNEAKDIAWSLERINRLRWDYKPVFGVEYLLAKDEISKATTEMAKLGIVPTFQHRSLDGSDPTDPSLVRKPGSNVGTPEYIATACKDKRWW